MFDRIFFVISSSRIIPSEISETASPSAVIQRVIPSTHIHKPPDEQNLISCSFSQFSSLTALSISRAILVGMNDRMYFFACTKKINSFYRIILLYDRYRTLTKQKNLFNISMVVILMSNAQFHTMTDEELATLASAGNNEAIDFLLDKYRNLVLIIARSYFLIGADRDDITQEGMIGLFKAIRDYKEDNEASFSTFAHMCIKRQILSAIKTATRKKHLPLNTYISLNNTTYDDEQETTLLNVIIDKEKLSPEDIIIDKEAHEAILDSIKAILSEYETTVLEKYLKGMSYTDIAAELGKTEKSIDNALQRIKKKIEKHFKSEL